MLTTLSSLSLPPGPIAVLGIDSGKAGAWCLMQPERQGCWSYGQWTKMGDGQQGLDMAKDIAVSVLARLLSPIRYEWTTVVPIHEVPVGEGRCNGHVTFRPAHWIVGALRGILRPETAVIPVEIMPATWQGAFGIGGHMGRKDRKAAAILTVERMYGIKCKADLADAILMATWGRDEMRANKRGGTNEV
jgi:hypothetical protein